MGPIPEGAADKVYIVLLNWNGWRDTIECLETVLRNSYPHYQIVVCDNGSQDSSLERIKEWANGGLAVEVPGHHSLRHLSFPPVPKPVPYAEYDRTSATELSPVLMQDHVPLVLIDNQENLGFAKGSNVGIRYALGASDCGYVWLLNNDTVIEPAALSEMVKRMRETPELGMCGSKLVSYDDPTMVQSLGGAAFNRWLAGTAGIGAFSSFGTTVDRASVERKMDFVAGPSLLVSRAFLEDIGLLSEDYFVYFEEIDWAVRARGRYRLGFAPDSVVYHKLGKSIGSTNRPRGRSATADYYGLRNRIVFTRKFFPGALPTVYLGLWIALVRRALRGEWERVKMAWKVIWTT